MMQHDKIEDVPYIVEYKVTMLAQDVPVSYTYYSQEQVLHAIKRLQTFGKRYELTSSLYPVH